MSILKKFLSYFLKSDDIENKDYHTESNIHNSLDVKLSNVTVPDEFGVYKATVRINGILKKAGSTLFPKEWSNQKIIDEINYAYNNKLPRLNPRTGTNVPGRFVGNASNGMEIEMKIVDGKIADASPIYKEK